LEFFVDLSRLVTVDGLGASDALPACGCFRSCTFTPVKPTLGFASHGWGLALLFGTLGVSLTPTTPNPPAS